MRIPILSDIIEARKQNIQLRERQISLREKEIKAKEKFTKNILALSGPARSMNNELYNSNGSYKIGRWDLPIEQLRRQSRIAYWESTEAQSLINRWVQIVVGKGLSLQSSPAWDMIAGGPKDDEARQELVRKIETRWKIYSSSKKCHYLQESTIDQLIYRAFFNYLYDGEFFLLLRYQINGQRNPLTIEIIAPESISCTTSENQKGKGNTITDGIEYDSRGLAVAYHICDLSTGKSVRVPAKGPKSGRTFVIHRYNKINERQRRGVPMLSGVITELTRVSDLKATELQAAVINALLAVWVEPPEGRDGEPVFKGKVGKKTNRQEVEASANLPGYNSKLEDANFDRGGIIVDQLPAGHKIQSFDTKRPNVNIGEFIKNITRSIYSGKDMSESVAEYNMKSNYTAARGELIILYEKVLQLRKDIPADVLNEIYTMWLWGESDGNKIPLPGYDNEETRDAWSFAVWKGSQKPDVDPEKSAKAHQIERNEAWKTNQQITAERDGGDFDDNVRRTTSENQKIAVAREPLVRQEKTTYSQTETRSEVVE